MNLNKLKDKHKNSLLQLLQKYEKMFDGTLGKYTGSDYTIELKEDAKALSCQCFSYSNNSRTNTLERR